LGLVEGRVESEDPSSFTGSFHPKVSIDTGNFLRYNQGVMEEKNNLPSILQEQRQNFFKKDFGVRRELLENVKNYVKVPQVVVITGLRRVGKSTLLFQLAKEFLGEDFFFVNFEDERLVNFKAEDFDFLHETLVSLYGDKKVFLIDEIQNVPNWEKFVRRMHDSGYKFFVTGSNASLLSQELGTRLTGRCVSVELFPFSFKEFLSFKNFEFLGIKNLTTVERGNLRRLCNEYLKKGGIPDSLKYPRIEVHSSLYSDVLYRDIVTRYKIENVRELKGLAHYIVTNASCLISFNKLKNILKLGSVSTVGNYINYLENSWLCFVVNKYAYSLKEQEIAPKKVYIVDTGLSNSVGFSFSKNKGKLMENLVFLHLKRRHKEIYYYKTKSGYELDLFLPKGEVFVQVAESLKSEKTRNREIRSILELKKENKNFKNFTIVTLAEKEKIKEEGVDIEVVPLYEFLLS
jgi:uncharacterized protein